MNSHAHVLFVLLAPKEVNLILDLNLSASSSSHHFSPLTRSSDRQSATNAPSCRYCPGSLLTSPDKQTERETESARESVCVCERDREREGDGEREADEDLNTLPCRYEFQWFGDSISNECRCAFLQRESKRTEALIGRHPIGNL